MTIYADKKDGKLTGRWRVEVQREGKRYRKRFESLKEAKQAEAMWTLDPSQADVSPTKRHDKRGKPKTLEDLMRKSHGSLWRGLSAKDQSYQRLEAIIKALGNPEVNSVTMAHLDDIVHEWGETKAGATINRYLSALNALLKWGVDRNYVTTVPKMPWQQEGEGRIRWITEEEEHKLDGLLRSYGRDDVADLVYCAIRTGMRRGELLGLTERDVEPTWVRLWKTKTKTPRSVPIDEVTQGKLLSLVSSMPSIHDIRYYWGKARMDMGLADDPWFVFHACRHTCATRLVQANVNLRVVQQYLGHKRIETTVRYAQVNDTMLQFALGCMTDDKKAGEKHGGQQANLRLVSTA